MSTEQTPEDDAVIRESLEDIRDKEQEILRDEQAILADELRISDEELREAHDRGQLIVQVFSPRTDRPKRFAWTKTMLVGDAAREAAKAFGYQAEKPGLETDKKPVAEVLPDNKTLEGAGVRSGQCLELIDTGGGV